MMKVLDTSIPEVKVLQPKRFGDERGFFMETFRDQWFREHVADVGFVQDNHSKSKQGLFGIGVVVIRAFINELGRIGKHQEAVRESGWDPHLKAILSTQPSAIPMTKSSGVLAQVHCHVEHFTRDNPN